MPRKELLVALRATLVTLVLTGIAYPLLTTGVALALFPGRARGSLVADEQGRVIGSELIAQPFSARKAASSRNCSQVIPATTRFPCPEAIVLVLPYGNVFPAWIV